MGKISYFELTKELKNARGQRWVDLREMVCGLVRPRIDKDIAINGTITLFMIGDWVKRFDINLKTLTEWLESEGYLPVGKYDEIKRGGWTQKKLLEAIEKAESAD